MIAPDPTVERPARLLLVVYALWAAVIGAWGPTAPMFPDGARLTLGAFTAATCVAAAVHPAPQWLRAGFFTVSLYAFWSALRVMATDYPTPTAIAGAATYVAMALTALTMDVLTAVLHGIDAAARGPEADE